MSQNEMTPNSSPAQTNSKLVGAAFIKVLAAIESGQVPADLKVMGALAELNRIAGALHGIEEAQRGMEAPQQLDLFEIEAEASGYLRAEA